MTMEVPTVENLNIRPSSAASPDLHGRAQELLSSYQAKPSIAALPDRLRHLLIEVVKPLFSANPHPSLAPSGRKAHFASAPTVAFSDPIVLDDSDKPWKVAFTTLTDPLLSSILATYPILAPDTLKPTIEQHIFLLTPALLNLIDDVSPTSKATGFRLLTSLCATLSLAKSNILAPSGLTDVFIDAIKPNFLLLPTLTPESDSLLILRHLYPAYLSLINARFPPTLPSPLTTQPPSTSSTSDLPLRQTHLTHLLRHGLLASLTHLNLGTPHTIHPTLLTLLLHQLPPLITAIARPITTHLQTLLPLLRAALDDPFAATAAPDLLVACLAAVQAILSNAAPERVCEKWWLEILRGCVACWLGVVDDEAAGAVGRKDNRGGGDVGLGEVKRECRRTVRMLAEVVEKGGKGKWAGARDALVADTPELEELFD